MRKFVLPIILISILLASCSTTPKKPKGKVVFTSILPIKYFTDKIVGDRYDVEVMVPPGFGPETYSPSPKQITMLSEADAYFAIGFLGFEPDLLRKLPSINKNIKIFLVSKGIDLIRDFEDEHAGPDETKGIDPHIWESPKEARIISKNICEGMKIVDPDHREYYDKNLQSLLREISKIDSTVTAILSKAAVRKFVIFHPSLGYFARDYGLEQLPIEYEGKVPSPKHMQELIDKARSENIKMVFIQKEFDIRNAEIVARDIGGKEIQIDPLDYDWPKEMITIASQFADNP